MAVSPPSSPAPERARAFGPEPIVIIGAGPAGVRVAEDLLKRDPRAPIVLYGDEPWRPHHRVQLSAPALGEVGFDQIGNAPAGTPSRD